MAFPSRKQAYDSNTPSDLSSRTSMDGALYPRSSKGTTIQSYRGSISNSSVHNTSTAATRKDLFNRPGQGSLHHSSESYSGHGNCPTISDHKSFHHLEKSTFTFQNQSPSTETTWSYQAPPISRPQESISRPQEPVSLPQEPVSRPQATRSYTSEQPIHSHTYSYTLKQPPPPALIPLPQEPIPRPQEPDSRPQTKSHTSEQPIHSRTYSSTLKQPPPPAPIPLSQPNPHLHPAPRHSRTRPPQSPYVHTYVAPRGGPTYTIEPPAIVRNVRIPHFFLIQMV
jgi:hypothetical protein